MNILTLRLPFLTAFTATKPRWTIISECRCYCTARKLRISCSLDSPPIVFRQSLYGVEDMHCSHCEAAVVRAVEDVPGVEKAKASASANTLTIKGPATEEAIRTAVEGIGYTFKGRSNI